MEKFRARSIFVSDVHLGTPGCKADALLDFLKHYECERLYLVGDIIDMWRLKSRIYWPQAHNNVLRKIIGFSKKGTAVTYVIGNHDEYLRRFLEDEELTFGNINITDECVHETALGKKLLVVHGDRFDGVVRYARWVAVLGSIGYESLLVLNRGFNWIRQQLGLGYWSLSAYIKGKVKQAVSFVSNFEHALAKEARDRKLDGVVCGHIHRAEIRDIDGILYCNDGDWVESCTAIVEDIDGNLSIVHHQKGIR